ncbi:MAG: tocopherol cyclase family protein [Saprospiraceae bacterium]
MSSFKAAITNVWHPSRFQGAGKRRSYFEGYYVKIVDAEQDIAMALIPGVSYDAEGKGHAFIQVLDGVAKTAVYHPFDLKDFAYAKTGFDLTVGESRFHESGCEVVLPDLSLSLSFRQNLTWPWEWWSPGAMGPFSFVPGMECKHGVMSLHHTVQGSFHSRPAVLQDQTQALNKQPAIQLSPTTVGYIEKDWGKSFPRGWVWLQTNHLAGETEPCCLMVSAGRVPWVTGAFRGFITAIHFRGRFIPFTTYNGARFELTLEDDCARMVFSRKGIKLTIIAFHAPGVDLISPIPGDGMLGRVNESMQATATVTLTENGKTLLETTASWVGFEIGGDAASWK